MFSHAAERLVRSPLLITDSCRMEPSETVNPTFSPAMDLKRPTHIGSPVAAASHMVPASSKLLGLFEVTLCVILSLQVRPLEEVSTTEHA